MTFSGYFRAVSLRRHAGLFLTAVAVTFAVTVVGSATADPVCQTNWTGTSSTAFLSGINWTAGVPGPGVHGCIDTGTTVVLSASHTSGGLTVGSGSTLQVGNFSAAVDFNLGATGLVNDGTIAMNGNLGAFVELDGSGGSLENRGVISSGGSSTNVIRGPVTNAAGGSVQVNTNTNLVGSWTNSGTVTVTGSTLGDSAPVAFTQASGGVLAGTGVMLFDLAGGTFTWSGTGGSITMTSPPRLTNQTLTYTNTGSGTVNIRGASTVTGTIGSAQTLRVGDATISADANVAGLLTNNGTIQVVGSSGSVPELDVRAGGSSLVNNALLSAEGSTTNFVLGGSITNAASGTFQVTSNTQIGGTWTNSGTVTVAGGVSLLDSATTELTTTGTASGGGPVVFDAANSFLKGTGNFAVSTNVRRLIPGASPGILNVAALTLPGAPVTEVEIGGTTPGTGHDQVNVTGTAILGGTLALSSFGGFTPAACDAFTVMTWGARSGTFSSVTGATIGGMTLTPVYLTNSLVLLATPTGSPVSIDPTSVAVAEGGATATYDICAAGQTSSVTVTPDPGPQVTVSPPTAVFAPGSAVIRTITVTAVDDAVVEGAHVATIAHTSTSAQPAYNGLSLPNVQANVTDNDSAPPRPYGRIRLGNGALTPNDVYNTNGAGQSRSANVGNAGTATFTVQTRNDSAAVDDVRVRGGASTTQFKVTYRDGATDVTNQVVAGTFEYSNLAPGATRNLTVTIKARSGTPVNATITNKVTLTSQTLTTVKDAVKAKVTRR